MLLCSPKECYTISKKIGFRHIQTHYRWGFCAFFNQTKVSKLLFDCPEKATNCYSCETKPPEI